MTTRCGWSLRPPRSGSRWGTRSARNAERWLQPFGPTTASIQLQVDAQEWMGHQVERLVQAMDLQQDVEEVLALAVSASQIAGTSVPPSSLSLGSAFAPSTSSKYETIWDPRCERIRPQWERRRGSGGTKAYAYC